MKFTNLWAHPLGTAFAIAALAWCGVKGQRKHSNSAVPRPGWPTSCRTRRHLRDRDNNWGSLCSGTRATLAPRSPVAGSCLSRVVGGGLRSGLSGRNDGELARDRPGARPGRRQPRQPVGHAVSSARRTGPAHVLLVHHAGGGASTYRPWAAELPAGVEALRGPASRPGRPPPGAAVPAPVRAGAGRHPYARAAPGSAVRVLRPQPRRAARLRDHPRAPPGRLADRPRSTSTFRGAARLDPARARTEAEPPAGRRARRRGAPSLGRNSGRGARRARAAAAAAAHAAGGHRAGGELRVRRR